MGLLVRVRHALGERVLELPERGVDDPIVVGRAADADVQIPSINVAPRHLVLFVHEGHWVAQDAGRRAAAGAPDQRAAPVGARRCRGGRADLGPEANAPTLEIDPSSMPAAESTAPTRAGRGHGPARRSRPDGYGFPATAASVPPAPARQVAASGPPPPVPAGRARRDVAPEADANGDDATGGRRPSRRHRGRMRPRRSGAKSSDAVAVAFAVVASLAMVTAGGSRSCTSRRRTPQPTQMTVLPPTAPRRRQAGGIAGAASASPRFATLQRQPPSVAAAPPPPPEDATDQLEQPPRRPANVRPRVTTPGRSRRVRRMSSAPAVVCPPRTAVPETPVAEMPEEPLTPEAARS